MDLAAYAQQLGETARVASRQLARVSSAQKNQALALIADKLLVRTAQLQAANAVDLQAAEQEGLDAALIDRLRLDDKAILAMAAGVRQIIDLPDPVGEISNMRRRPSGIQVGHMRVPLGVVAIIYESRPNVTADAAALCLKSGNACILRGGKEALHSNQAIAECINEALREAGLPAAAVQIVNTVDRAVVGHLLTMNKFIDVIIPRGGKSLIERVSKESSIPVIKHLDGNCHVYVHYQADPAKVLPIVENAKTQRYGTCNTAESLLIDEAVSAIFLPDIGRMFARHQVEVRGCEQTLRILKYSNISGIQLTPAIGADWYQEYLAPIIAIKVVTNIDAAIDHINHYSSSHTESIITENYSDAMRFLREVDSASVLVNASTRFADGFEFGLGAEIGISTDKIHARGPVGLEGLTSNKWVIFGEGQIRR